MKSNLILCDGKEPIFRQFILHEKFFMLFRLIQIFENIAFSHWRASGMDNDLDQRKG